MAVAVASKSKFKSIDPIAAAVVAALATPPLVQIGPSIDRLIMLREEKRKHQNAIDLLEAQYNETETALFARLDSEGTTKGAGASGTASITESVVGNVIDWEAFNAWVVKKKYLHLYQKRLSDPAVRELFEKGTVIPGCVPFTKRRLNLRAAGSSV